MNRKSIVILILLAAIFAAVIYSLQKKEPFIEKAIISNQESLSEAQLQDIADGQTDDSLLSSNTGIYAVFAAKNLKTGQSIDIKWFMVEEDREELIQEDSIALKKGGSGRIVTGLIMKNGAYAQGNYRMEYTFNGGSPVTLDFTVK